MSRKNPYAKPDVFTQRAKSAGYPARSIYKLEEIDRRARLLKGGMHVLDLGASPGSWSLYAAQKIGASGRLLAVDLDPLKTALPQQATFFQGDALSLDNEALAMHAPYDVVLSDMAPRTTGNTFVDQARSHELFMRALAVAVSLAKVGGSFVGKIFMGNDLPLARAELKKHFAEERMMRPDGTRSVSFELFVIGLGRRAT